MWYTPLKRGDLTTIKWTKEDDEFFKKHYNVDMSIQEIATHYGSTYRAIQLRACRVGRTNPRQKLNACDFEFIRNNYKSISTNKLAVKFKVDTHTIRSALNKMGLENPRSIHSKTSKWSKEETSFLLNNYQNFSLGVLGEYLDRTPKSVERKISILNLPPKGRPKSCESLLEIKVGRLLTELGLTFDREFCIGSGFSVDFFLPEYSLCIEAQGTYWHTQEYQLDHANSFQLKTYEKDARKKSLMLKSGYNVMYLWEDMLNNIVDCKKFVIDHLPPLNLVNCGK